MQLLTKQLREMVPPLYSTENESDPLALCKFFTPDAHWTWYVLEFDGSDLCFGYVVGDEPELGYFSLKELAGIRGKLGLPVERDLYFEPTPLSVLKVQHAL